MADSHDVERWKNDLFAADWVTDSFINWRAPDGSLWRGPYGAWKELERRKEHAAMTITPNTNSTYEVEPEDLKCISEQGAHGHVHRFGIISVPPEYGHSYLRCVTCPLSKHLPEHDVATCEICTRRAPVAGPSESPILAFDKWLIRYVADCGKLSQKEYGIAYAAFIAAHPGEGPLTRTMNAAPPTKGVR